MSTLAEIREEIEDAGRAATGNPERWLFDAYGDRLDWLGSHDQGKHHRHLDRSLQVVTVDGHAFGYLYDYDGYEQEFVRWVWALREVTVPASVMVVPGDEQDHT